MSDVLTFILVLICILCLSFLIDAGIIALICLCFGIAFSWKLALGIWLILLLIGGLFKAN